MLTNSLPSSSAWWVSILQTKKPHNFPWKPSHKYRFAPKSTFPPRYPPWSCGLMPWRQSPVPALAWWSCDGNWRWDTVGLWLESEQLSPSLASQWNQTVLPRKVQPDQTSHTAPPLSVLMEEAGELERGIFSAEVEFHTFSEMIFQFLIFYFFPFSC